MIELVKIALEDIQKAFDIEENLFEVYWPEIEKDSDLSKLISKRQDFGDWTKRTQLGGPGTSLNGIVLYCLTRHYDLYSVLETGVSGGFYTSFLLAATKRNHRSLGEVYSLELSVEKDKVGHLVPDSLRSPLGWKLGLGIDSLKYLGENSDRKMQLYCHDSLHTYEHMLAELLEFKKCEEDQFFIYIDDQDTDDFWRRCLYLKLFQKKGYDVKYISGNESRLKGHMGGFIKYEKA